MKSLLVIAHPGHELLLWKWLRVTRPEVIWLTNGAGSSGVPRLEQSLEVLQATGARWAEETLTPVADATVYESLLQQDHARFDAWCDAVTRHVIAHDIECLVADEAEDYNPSHDLCRLLANEVARRVGQAGRPLRSLAYPTVGHPSLPQRLASEPHEMVRLSPEELETKIEAMRAYATASGDVLLAELEGFLRSFGAEAYGQECLFEASPSRYERASSGQPKPFFETAGEKRVAEGVYRFVIRASHLQAVADHWHP